MMINKRGDNVTLPANLVEQELEPRINYYFAIKHAADKKEENALAEEYIFPNGKRRHRVMANNKGNLFNPYGIYGESHLEVKSGIRTWDFKDVPEPVFQQYLAFLTSQNEARLRIAERSLS